MKKCPFCAEEIQDQAIKCRFCNEFLNGQKPKEALPWYSRTGIIITALLTVGPFALFLVWMKKDWSLFHKTLISVIVLVISILLWVITQQLMQQLTDQMKALGLTL